jgi:hypothetical protein
MFLADRQQCGSRRVELAQRIEQILAHGEALDGRTDVLPAAPGVQPRHVGPADPDQRLLDDEVIAGTPGARPITVGEHAAHGVGDLAAERLRHDPALDHHDGRGLVDLAQPVERIMLLRSSRCDHGKHPAGGEPSPTARRLHANHGTFPPQK